MPTFAYIAYMPILSLRGLFWKKECPPFFVSVTNCLKIFINARFGKNTS